MEKQAGESEHNLKELHAKIGQLLTSVGRAFILPIFGAVRIIACSEDPVVIEKILTHLDKKSTEGEGWLCNYSRSDIAIKLTPAGPHYSSLFREIITATMRHQKPEGIRRCFMF